MNKRPLVYTLDEEDVFVYPPKNNIKELTNKILEHKNKLIIISTVISIIGLAAIKQKYKK